MPASAPSPDASALTSSTRRRLAVIVNPNATTTSPRLRSLVVHALSHRYDVQPVDTEAPSHAIELARQAVRNGVDAVVTLGGDGTVNEAANGLVGSDVPLIPLPGGATNVYHRLIGMPQDIVDATEHVLSLADDWHPRAMDLARVGDRWFTFSAGIGLDASVVARVDRNPRLKARLGPWYYATAAVDTFVRQYTVRPPRFTLEFPDREAIQGATAIFQNASGYTFFGSRSIQLIPGQTLTSGTVSGAVLRHTRPTIMPGVIARAVSDRIDLSGHSGVDSALGFTLGTLRSNDERALPVHVDGDYIGEITEAEISVLPGGLKVVS